MAKNIRNYQKIKAVYFKDILREIFYVFGEALAIFFILEFFFPGLVLAYINVNVVLIFWLVIGIFIIVFDKKENES